MQRDLVAGNPNVDDITERLCGRPLSDQFTIQAAGERLGAATWRSFARDWDDASGRDILLACAELEEANAEVLEALLAAKG